MAESLKNLTNCFKWVAVCLCINTVHPVPCNFAKPRREKVEKKQGSLTKNLYRNLDRTSLIHKKSLIKEIMMHVKICYDKFTLACSTSNLSDIETCELSLYQQ